MEAILEHHIVCSARILCIPFTAASYLLECPTTQTMLVFGWAGHTKTI